MTSELIGLVEDGLVDPGVVEASLDRVFVSDIARGSMLLSAARGAMARGDRLGVVRLVRAAWSTGAPAELLDFHTRDILREADEDLSQMIASALGHIGEGGSVGA